MIHAEPLVKINNLVKYFPVSQSTFLSRRKSRMLYAVNGVSFEIYPGETLGLVGESGCGKTTLGRCVLQLYRPTSGEVLFHHADLTKLNDNELRPFRKKMQLIFQDPFDSLDPRMTAADIITEPLVIHGINVTERNKRLAQMLSFIGFRPYMAERYPHEFSGGQRQRLGVARALAPKPEFIVCDEPLSALDVSVQAQIINLLDDLQKEFNVAYLFISHDLSVVRHISDRVMVMYLGRIMEIASRDKLYENPLHPYTRALLSAVPIPDPDIEIKRKIIILHGEPPNPSDPPSGCVFHPRCPEAFEDCSSTVPQLKDTGSGQKVACLLYETSHP